MYKYVLATGLTLLLCACNNPQQPATQTASNVTPTATVTAPGYADDQPDEVMPPRSAAELSAAMLDRVLSDSARGTDALALDDARHPGRTLAFFGLRPDMSVIEVAPDKGWYATILAPLLKRNGTYTADLVSPLASKQAGTTMQSLRKMFKADPARFARARLASFDPRTPNFGTPGSADMVLSFRDAHAWVARGTAGTMFKAIHDVLKPGGVLGLVDNRAPEDSDADDLKDTAYLRQAEVVKLATQAGFTLDAASNINANPEDGIDHAQTPANADRMTLRFVKPAHPEHAVSA